jgi:hypothetical protein
MMILGPAHASNSCHTKHHEAKYMSMNEQIHHVPKHVPIVYQSYASINMPTMCIYQYVNHVHLPMVCLHHEPSIKIMNLNQSSVSTISSHMSYTKVSSSTNGVLLAKYYHQTYTIYECTKHVSLLVTRKYINHAPQLNEFSCIYAKSTTKHVPINLPVGASTNVLEVYQSCINSSMMYNMITSTTHQLHIPICIPTICQMYAPISPTKMLQ